MRRDRFVAARYTPESPDAYVGRYTWRSQLVYLWILLPLCLGVVVLSFDGSGTWFLRILALFMLVLFLAGIGARAALGEPVLVVDQPGVYLGASYAGEPGVRTGVVPWSRIGSVVLYRQRIRFVHGPRYKPAVGLSGRPDGTDVFAYRIKSGWTFDRRAIQSALDRFAPGVQVVDGPRRAAADAGP